MNVAQRKIVNRFTRGSRWLVLFDIYYQAQQSNHYDFPLKKA